MIYLDNAATTPMFDSSADVYKKYACECFYNPSAGYTSALNILEKLKEARKTILNELSAKSGEIIFTGGATESNNLAIMGSKRNGKWEYVFSIGEHPSVYNVAKELQNQGHIVHFVDLQKNGEVDYDKLKEVLNEKTRLISIMHVSNETGAINDLSKINNLRNKYAKNALFHVDGVQGFKKFYCNVDKMGIDFYTISAHKIHGPKGVGALYVKNLNTIKNIVFGGGQEFGYRSGTHNVAGIMSMVESIKKINSVVNFENVKKLNILIKNIFKTNSKISIIETENPYIISANFPGVNGETLMRALQDKGVLVGIGSACSSKKAGNRILENMGMNKDEVKSHLRISLNAYLSEQEVSEAANIILDTYKEIWEKVK